MNNARKILTKRELKKQKREQFLVCGYRLDGVGLWWYIVDNGMVYIYSGYFRE